MNDQFDICIPVCRNLNCLEVSMAGLRRNLADPKSVRKILLHVQDPSEIDESVSVILSGNGFGVEVVSVGTGWDSRENMVHPMNRLLAASKTKWAVMTEQDVFMRCNLDWLVQEISARGFDVAAPLDTFFYDNTNAIGKPKYGEYARLSGQPGLYHSALMVINREYALSKSKTPFSIPQGHKMHGTGVLGGEEYHGLRINLGQDRSRLAFFRQLHGDYGYSADIFFGENIVATHLYYSSHQPNYIGTHLTPDESKWLESEENRFLEYYAKTL